MTSVLNVDTIANKAGTGPVALTKQSAAKAFLKFGTSSSTASLGSPFNVSGLTDNGTGNTTVAFTSSFSDANYSVSFGVGVNQGSNQNNQFIQEVESQAVGTLQIISHSSGTKTDANYFYSTMHGDLA